MRQASSFLSVGFTIILAAGPVFSGCSGAEFGVFDSPGVDSDGATDGRMPTDDRNATAGSGGSGGTGASGTGGTGTGGTGGMTAGTGGTGAGGGTTGGSGGTGAGGSGGTGARGADAGGDDGRGGDATDPSDDASSDNRSGDGQGDSLDSLGGGDSDRSGDVADATTLDTSADTDAKDGSSDTSTDGRTDASVDTDARDTSTDPVCSEPTVYFRDLDLDGFGTNNLVISACVPPGNDWSPRSGDCRDDLPAVKPFVNGWPNPPQYSGTGYADSNKPQGISFDYDCSGTETADPSNPYGAGPPNCGGLLDCKGAGYLPVNPARSGPGIDPRCGSMTLQRCNGKVLGCDVLPPEVTQVSYRCR